MKDELIFLNIALSQMPRILGFLDKNPHSKTCGCFDRCYWHYKTSDFSNARFQEAVLALSLVYFIDSPTNHFYRSSTIKNWVFAGLGFWSRARHSDGSTDESYPFERHFCSTAFSCYAITESLLLFGEKGALALGKTGDFLIRHNRLDVANQMACGALTLYNLYELTGDNKYHKGFEEKLSSLLKMQAKDGFFMEYGGFDAGYDSITLSFLALIYKKNPSQDIEKAALNCVKNIEKFIDDEGYIYPGGMSRNTQFLYPLGFAQFCPDVLVRLKRGLEKNIILNPSWLDDRYCIPMICNYLQTYIKGS
ncbi:MAG: hypothetical protein PHV17_04265 [Candidatus Omnitrophica bacterium]|nr:hypothetical protein [Candidatus Omnitrophota bacterium]